ncbi:similar to Saccharomyces cerevisiae YNL153C GIM3 Subunit of the heterohexameric cochaperone prefoldin complex which binds specifically to cytosolic chaperonin and transfers target proteins to it [Maudiozyma barnettii]|uniref:Prefoldin subunit 4 n=1 Tax=Maudiozyma barnettii TaxID=61262 RepID=A0A8H2VKQ4_9SACH|nr:tubulin-binding prefolding complex subunit GIM3 [Kazachstania barnettii]CAB4257241.1 similar to Saccharomyces cerevisiae YNL153C GIM3 Subunit of the heterohexameric cochaperone prefoldin complex which binds specifically to cytosolic chaperonin and transfers target proteins to it [Kazachstania barnettii]CAD1779611.1 similar to Saccharomyces cerevisiae YNL153C GIM3 Subunit of the heterohexameric cochaperone prefoldin complex which binds specifically to cytosolic chaperonin and transfers target p
MELLPEGKKNTVQVTLADQKKINEFSKLIMRKDVCEADLAQQRQEKEYLEDVSLEIELIDEDEKVQYKIGELFVFLKQSEVVEQLEKDGEVIDEKIENLESRETEINERLATLKSDLYAKFGDNINLER